ncbi:MAG: SpoIIE family protein phosphatase [Eubacteriales bacterium]|nr:SpoIIE family protein phosphatase [Eubacteriales bacterium]
MKVGIGSIALKKDTGMSWDKTILATAVIAVIAAFATAGAETAGGAYPFAIAYMAAAIKHSRMSIYLLPIALGAIAVRIAAGAQIIGDASAVILVTVVFLVTGKIKFENWHRVLICVSSAVICNVLYFLAADLLYRFNLKQTIFEVAAIAISYFIFDKAAEILTSREKVAEESKEIVITTACAAIAIVLCGLVPISVNEVAMGAGFFVVMVFGYRFGVSAGIAGSAATALVFYFCGMTEIIGIYAFLAIGLGAGIFKGLNKYTASLVLASVGALLGNIFPALGAAAVFAALPEKWASRLDEKFAISSAKGEECLETLKRYKKCFASLGKLYSIEKSSRSIISYQFRGMEQTVDKMVSDIIASESELQAVTEASPRYKAQAAAATYFSKESVSGDSYSCRRLDDGRHLFILSDGMGKGTAAAAESGLAVRTLSDLIEAGFEIETSLRTLNSILLLKSEDEIFSTIDIGVFDEKTGRLKLYKIGAASTFIKRKNTVKSIKMAALPMGIIDDLRIDFVTVKLRPSDQIIMVSDGVTDSMKQSRDGEASTGWLTSAIASINSKDPQTMADLIVNRAVENYGLREKDDLTVISILIK